MVRYGAPAVAVVLLGSAAFAATDRVVSQKGKAFGPMAIAVKAGETLQIANDDDIVHHVFINSDAISFDSGHQSKGETVAIRFTRIGNYEVRCAIHPKMKLAVTVN
ncbi:MAG: cupredoxin domain-containing protein [Alphaproteobacteria bacterium]